MDIPLFWSDRFKENHLGDYNLMRLENKLNGRLILAFQITPTSFLSPGQATFGGFWVESNVILSESEFFQVIQKLKKEYGYMKFDFRFPPNHIKNRNFINQIESIRRNYEFSETDDVNQHLDLSNWSLAAMSYGNRKKIQQFNTNGGRIHECNPSMLEESLSVLEFSRTRKGLTLTMQKEHLINNLTKLHNDFRFYTAELNGEVIGAAITVDIGFSTRYVLYWGDSDLGRKYSVTAAICEFIANSTKMAGITKLDLGVSSVGGTVDAGLHQFKLNLGAVDSSRKTLVF